MGNHNRLFGRRTLVSALLTSAALLTPGLGWSQQAPAPTAAPQSDPSSQQTEIIVTAEKRKQRLIDVPTSITAVTSQDIKNNTMIALSDISARVPNVVMSGSSLFPNITIRGVGSSSGTQTGVDPAVDVYVDDVYQGRERAVDVPLAGVQQIEVLRGPQGTLYGENTIGGAINITTLKPSNQFVANADLLAGNLGFVQTTGVVSGPLNQNGADNLFGSITGIYRNRDGFIHNDFTGKDLDYDRAGGLRARLVYDATSRLSFDLDADYLHENDSESLLTTGYAAIPIPPFDTLPPLIPGTRSESVDSPENGSRTVYGASARINYDFDSARLTSISSYRAYTSAYAFDSDGTPLPVDAENDIDDATLFTQELRLTSTSRGPFQWIAGAYYSHQRLVDTFDNEFLSDFPTILLGLPSLPSDYYNSGITRGLISSNSYAIYLSGTYALSARWSISGGFRYTIDQKSLEYSQRSTDLVGSPIDIIDLVLVPIPHATANLSESVPTGDISLSYKFTPDQVGYIKFSRGYKAGGFNAYLITPPFNPATQSFAFQPEYINNYEAGYKASWWAGRLTLSSSVFYDDYTNKQEAVEDPLALSIVIRNAAKATVYGAELQGGVEPVQGLTISATAGLLNAKYDQFPNAGVANSCNCFTGNSLPNAPHVQISFATQYEHELPEWPGYSGMARIEAIYTSKSFSDPNNTPGYAQGPVTYLNAKVGVANSRWGFYLWGNNITNQYHLSGGLYELVATARAVNLPATFGGELSFKY